MRAENRLWRGPVDGRRGFRGEGERDVSSFVFAEVGTLEKHGAIESREFRKCRYKATAVVQQLTKKAEAGSLHSSDRASVFRNLSHCCESSGRSNTTEDSALHAQHRLSVALFGSEVDRVQPRLKLLSERC